MFRDQVFYYQFVSKFMRTAVGQLKAHKRFICLALSVAPQRPPCTLWPVPAPRPLLTSENLEPAWCGLPQRPTPKPANFSEPSHFSPQGSAWRCTFGCPPAARLHLPAELRTLLFCGFLPQFLVCPSLLAPSCDFPLVFLEPQTPKFRTHAPTCLPLSPVTRVLVTGEFPFRE